MSVILHILLWLVAAFLALAVLQFLYAWLRSLFTGESPLRYLERKQRERKEAKEREREECEALAQELFGDEDDEPNPPRTSSSSSRSLPS